MSKKGYKDKNKESSELNSSKVFCLKLNYNPFVVKY